MTLRTPRRRISPRTKRRYRAIREFFRRALGSPSQQDIKINSSIAINVTDLKHKIVGLEQQLNEVNKHCQNLVYLDSISQKESGSFDSELKHDIGQAKEHIEGHGRQSNDIETKLLYKTSESHYRRSDESEYTTKNYNDDNDNAQQSMMKSQNFDTHDPKAHKKILTDNRAKDYNTSIHKHKTRSAYENVNSAYSSNSFRSLADPKTKLYDDAGYSGHHGRRRGKREVTELTGYANQDRQNRHKDKRREFDSLIRNYDEKRNKSHKSKHKAHELDQHFIADIIKKQYRPIKMFGRKESEISQFSAPVCRDQEFTIQENIIEGSELCSCCYDGHKHTKYNHHNDVCDMRSVCDTRLYSTKRRSRSKHHRKQFDIYNDSNLYDLIPVKEKTSPKSRRKFVEDNVVYNNEREVPPSPRTHRPRLNLKSQYYAELEDYIVHAKQQNIRQSPHRSKKHQEYNESIDSASDVSTEIPHNSHGKNRNKLKHSTVPNKQDNQQDAATISSVPYTHIGNEHTNVTVDTQLNKTQETDLSVDKTDKALCEIKDILQHFLQEIKKDTTASQFDKSEIITKTEENITGLQQTSGQVKSNAGHSFNNFNPNCSLSPYIPPFTNPCCYPIMPMCPMNCVQSGYIVSSPSYTCATCANISKESTPNESNHKNTKETHNTETEELIKEIYKFIAQSPTPTRKKDQGTVLRTEATAPEPKFLTSRSVGGSSKSSKHDAKVGTPRIKCYSKSCEAIGSKINTDTYCSNTNASYSDTILEKLSLEASASQSESETSETDATAETGKKKNKFTKVLRSIGLFKKKKRDTIEELSESESTAEMEVKPKAPPFRQEILNYSMLGQQYFNRPPMPSHNSKYISPHPDYRNECQHPPYNPKISEYQMPHDMYYQRQVHEAHIHEQAATRHFLPQNPSAPPFPSYESYNHLQSQVPLCLKEIEVKSTGTQSERRMSIFNKFKKKMQPPQKIIKVEDPIKTCSTQTKAAQYMSAAPAEPAKPGLFNWKNLQAKAMQGVQGLNDPMAYSYKTQKQLVDGDKRMRNAMLRKLFYKKNPLSPNNLLVRTIMGKDKSSFGDPPRLGRARMFF